MQLTRSAAFFAPRAPRGVGGVASDYVLDRNNPLFAKLRSFLGGEVEVFLFIVDDSKQRVAYAARWAVWTRDR